MSGGLYQKPGHASTEYQLTVSVLIACGACTVIGAVLAFWVSGLLGIVVIGSSAVVASSAIVGYALSRGKVKAAAESNRPPSSRVC